MTHAMTDEEQVFHAGEAAQQAEAGVRERMARIGAQVFRDHLPEVHRRFFEQLPFVVVGSVDPEGQPHASPLVARPGFVSSPNDRTLRVDALPDADDPLARDLVPGAPLALLGIEPHTRRRNRANGRVLERDARGFSLHVTQSFGNCPKHIRPRRLEASGRIGREPSRETRALDARGRALIEAADTFFIASSHPDARAGAARSHGVDVSHRGGPPGFCRFVDEATFVIPDFSGNDFFNTLGNVRLNERVGLVFVDFAQGDVLQLDAVAVVRAGAPPSDAPAQTGRIVRFRVRRARSFPARSPLRAAPEPTRT